MLLNNYILLHTPQPLRFETLSLKTPQTILPTLGTALQNKIQNKIEKSLGSQLNISSKKRGFPGFHYGNTAVSELRLNLSKNQIPKNTQISDEPMETE